MAFATLVFLGVCTACSPSAGDGPTTSAPAAPEPATAAQTESTAAPSVSPTSATSARPTTSAPAVPTPLGPTATTAPVTGTSQVILTFSGWNATANAVQVSGYVAVVENDGRCRVNLSKGGSTVTAESTAYPDAGTTSCGWISVPAAQLSAGTWQAAVTYTSSTTHASSSPVTIEVP
jgi:hypothetical protein